MADELKTIPIKAPRLNQPGYGSNIEKVFENIDTNFRIVGNHDFVKGNTGNCVGSESIHILNGDRFTLEGMLILNAIIQQIPSIPAIETSEPLISEVKNLLNSRKEYAPLRSVQVGNKEISLIDGFTDTDIINLITLYDPMYKEDTEKPIGATNDYLFRDPRFVYLVDDTQEQYSSLYDCSCTVHMQLQDGSEDFVCRTIQNAPTLYYDSTQQTFCWRIGGRKTGIIAQGPSGKSGTSAFTYIVRVEPTGNDYGVSGPGNMREIKGYIDPKTSNWIWSEEFPSDWAGSTCLALSYSDESLQSLQGVYVSIISKGNVVFCSDTNNLPTTFDVNHFMSVMAQINAAGGSENRGLFIPMNIQPVVNGKMNGPLHVIWAAKDPNDTTEKNSELHISPLTSGMVGVNAAYSALNSSGIYTTRIGNHVIGDARLFADYNTVVLDGPANQGNARLGIGTDKFDGLGCGILMREKSKIIMPEGTIFATDGLKIEATDGLKIEGDTVIYNSLRVKRTAKMSILSVDLDENNTGEMELNGNATFNGNTTFNGGVTVSDAVTAKVNEVSGVYLGCPIGTIVMWVGEKAPDGWLLCDGTYIFKATPSSPPPGSHIGAEFADLYDLLEKDGWRFGSSRLPDFRQKFPLGAKDESLNNGYNTNGEQITVDTSLGKHGGDSEVTLSVQTMPEHNHHIKRYSLQGNLSDATGSNWGGVVVRNVINEDFRKSDTSAYLDDVGKNKAHNNMPPYLAINFIIKYK